MTNNEILDRICIELSEPTYKQAVTEFLDSVLPYLEHVDASAEDWARLERLLIPERIVIFKVIWENDAGEKVHNRGYRVQFNAALGPYKGGLRFDGSVNEDILKFLGFEQIFKNSLTGLPLGGGKGGSDFEPKGKSDREVQRFCTAFMSELVRHIGPQTDVPAGDMGVGAREIGYLYGAYKRLTNRTDGALTGKGVSYNGSQGRIEATGFGTIYFIQEVLKHRNDTIAGKRVAISGSGNVALHAALRAAQEGATIVTLSDRGGYIVAEAGLSIETIEGIKAAKANELALSEMELPEGVAYHEGTCWETVPADIYIPSATQNEIDESAAHAIVGHGALMIAEASNMPLTLEALKVVTQAGIILAPSKAVNAGGVAVSGLEMTQNAGHDPWTMEEVDTELRSIMQHIHETCVMHGTGEDGSIDYVKGANIGGFVRVFQAMKELGW